MPGRPRHVGSSELARGSSRGAAGPCCTMHCTRGSGIRRACACASASPSPSTGGRPLPSLYIYYLQESAGDGDRLGRLPAARAPHPHLTRAQHSARRRQCDPRPSERFPGQKSSPYLDAPPQPQLGTSYVRGVSICACLGWSYHGYWYFHKLA